MIDLHCHSIFSDGTNTPEELVALAEQGGLSALALTDHDTTDGLPRFMAAAAGTSVQAVSGIELSAEFGDTALHILGYLFDPASDALQSALAWVREGRTERNAQILEKLNRLGYNLTYADIRKHSSDDLIGRPHFAAALIEKGHFKRKDKIFQQLLGKGKAAYVDRRRLSPEACVELICKAGGVAVIAHPGQMKITTRALRRLVKKLKEHGLGGLEVWHPTQQEYQSAAYLRICEDFDLAATGGSDFHGKLTPDLSIGRGFGNLEVSDHILEQLEKRR
ncbi:MAG: PHP domain-containing protein [Kiritimatiellales bacterium]|nr:PHP domain-containing protein [Kiritimatiellales bacterium]